MGSLRCQSARAYNMSREEQLSFFSQWNRNFADQLQAQSLMIIREIGMRIDALVGVTGTFGTQIHNLGPTFND